MLLAPSLLHPVEPEYRVPPWQLLPLSRSFSLKFGFTALGPYWGKGLAGPCWTGSDYLYAGLRPFLRISLRKRWCCPNGQSNNKDWGPRCGFDGLPGTTVTSHRKMETRA